MPRSSMPDNAPDPASSQPRVLFVGGAMKSGSTLLGALLGQFPGLFNVGELARYWVEVASGRGRCGCGLSLDACDFWAGVTADCQARGVELARMSERVYELDETRRLGRVLTRRFRSEVRAKWAELAAATQILYSSAWRRSGARYLVDVSKLPTHLLLLREPGSLDLFLLHLVRDGRAVAYSWERTRRKRTGSPKTGSVRGHRWAGSDVLVWALQNFMIERLGRDLAGRTLLRYEDLAETPRAALLRALETLGIAPGEGGVDERAPRLEPTHSIAGSPQVRFAESGTAIVPDDAWRRELGTARRRAWTLLAWPALRHYGYKT